MHASNDLSLISLMLNASIPVQLVMLILLGISVLSWTYIFSKRAALKRANEQTRRFEDDFWAGGDLSVLQQAVASRRAEHGSLARIFDSGMTEFIKARRHGNGESALDGPRRAMRATYQREMDSLESHLNFLASAGSVSPYYTSLQPPSASAFSLVTATGITATLSDMPSGRGMTMNNTGSGTNTMSSMQQPVSSQSAFTVTTCVYLASSLTSNWFVGIGVSDSSGKYDSFGWRNSAGLGTFNEFLFSSISALPSATSLFGAFNPNGPIWLRLQLTTGNFIFSASFDGENWETIQTVSATHYLGATLSNVGIIVDNNSSHHMIIDDLSWSQTTP